MTLIEEVPSSVGWLIRKIMDINVGFYIHSMKINLMLVSITI